MTNLKSKIQNLKSDEWLEVGTIVAPQGLDGEVRVYSDSDFPERFEEPGVRWLLYPGEREPRAIELLSGRYVAGKGLYVVEFAGVEDRNQAEALRGCKLMVRKCDRPILGEDEYHVSDLVGLEVFMQASGESIGIVVDVIPAGNDLLEVNLHQGVGASDLEEQKTKSNVQNIKSSKTVLIPFVKAIVPVVNLETGCVEITPPLGLLELE